jgi:hypothetical protein
MGGMTKSVKKIGQGNLMGVADLGIQGLTAGQVNTNGFKDGELAGVAKDLGGMLGLNDEKGQDSKYIDLDPGLKRVTDSARLGQESAIGKYKDLMGQNTNQIAENEIAGMENQARTMSGDVQRKATDLVSQRGLGNSSVGLNAIINSTRGLNDQIGGIRAKLPGLQRGLAMENLNTSTQGLNSILGAQGAQRAYQQGTEGTKGSLLPLLGMGAQAAGSYYGAKR